jgi:hypothetical protein
MKTFLIQAATWAPFAVLLTIAWNWVAERWGHDAEEGGTR